MYKLLNGKEVSNHIKQEVKQRIVELNIKPTLAVIVVGENPASTVYVRNKEKACAQVGIESIVYRLPEDTSEESLLSLISLLNNDPSVNGILVQLPLPNHIDANTALQAIDPQKDVDGFTAVNTGKLWLGDYVLTPCTAMGIIELLDYYNIDIEGKNCVVVGRSNIVGKPVAALLLERNATVTMCHSKTRNLNEFTRNADILIVAIGRNKFITEYMVKDGAVVIDVGINRSEDGKLCGDVDFENVSEKTSAITPVPGGIGLVTVAMLMKNTLLAAKTE